MKLDAKTIADWAHWVAIAASAVTAALSVSDVKNLPWAVTALAVTHAIGSVATSLGDKASVATAVAKSTGQIKL